MLKVFKKNKHKKQQVLANVSTDEFYYDKNKSKSTGDLPNHPTLRFTTNESIKQFCVTEMASLYASSPNLPCVLTKKEEEETTNDDVIYDVPVDLPKISTNNGDTGITYTKMPSLDTLRKVKKHNGYYCILNLSKHAILVPDDEILLAMNYPTRNELIIPSSDETLRRDNGVHMVRSWFDIQNRSNLFVYDPVKLDWPDVFANTNWDRDDNIWGISWKDQFSPFKFIPEIDLDGQFPEYNRYDLMPGDIDEHIMNMNDLLIEHDTKFTNKHVIDPNKYKDRDKRTMKPRNIKRDLSLIEIPKDISPDIIKKANKKCKKQYRRNTLLLKKRDDKRKKKQQKHPNVKYLYIE